MLNLGRSPAGDNIWDEEEERPTRGKNVHWDFFWMAGVCSQKKVLLMR